MMKTTTGLQLHAIVAMTPNRVIGKGNSLPWHLPEDLKQFKQRTTGHAILMGRRTYDSIGRPLPNRRNIVLTRQTIEIPGVEVVNGLEELPGLDLRGKTFVIGGAEVYRLALAYCHGIYLTRLKREYDGDVYFLEFEERFKRREGIFENEDFTVAYWVNRKPESL